jgi:hypothetical protein
VVTPVLPVASRTVAVRLTVPLAIPVVSQGSVTGPRLDVTWLATTCPFAEIVNVFAVPLWPSTQSVGHAVPLTIAPFAGWVMKTLSVPEGAGGGGAGLGVVFATITVRVAVALAPAASRTVRVSVCAVLLAVVVFHA